MSKDRDWRNELYEKASKELIRRERLRVETFKQELIEEPMVIEEMFRKDDMHEISEITQSN